MEEDLRCWGGGEIILAVPPPTKIIFVPRWIVNSLDSLSLLCVLISLFIVYTGQGV